MSLCPQKWPENGGQKEVLGVTWRSWHPIILLGCKVVWLLCFITSLVILAANPGLMHARQVLYHWAASPALCGYFGKQFGSFSET